MGQWRLWDAGNVSNELIRGETGWSSFEERERQSNGEMDAESSV